MSITIDVVPESCIFYSKENNYAIYGCKTTSSDVVLTRWNNFTLVGYMPELSLYNNYKMEVTEVEHPKYGKQYELQYIIQDTPSTIEEERDFLSTILTELQVEEIYKAYPDGNIVELIQNDEFDYNKVHGVGEFTYNIIKQKIEDNLIYQKALSYFSRFGINYNMIKKLVSKYTSVDILISKFNENPYFLADEFSGIGFKKCDAYALKAGMPEDSNFRIIACIKYILKKESNDNGHSWVSLNNIIIETSKILSLKTNIIFKALDNIDKDDNYLVITDDRIALYSNYLYEKEIASNIERLLRCNSLITIDNIDEKIACVEEKQGFKYTDEQITAIKLLLDNNIVIVNGKAGTGKSSILNGVQQIFNNYIIDTCALSGKAAQRITEITGFPSSTIHRLLGYNPSEGWRYNSANPLLSDLVILDEGTMPNNSLYYKLISAIKDGSKLLILGDTAQLEPIGAGYVMKDIINSSVVPVVTLTKVHRQAEKSGILHYANQIREGKQILNKDEYDNKVLGELKDLYVFPFSKADSVHNTVLNIAKKYKGDIFDFQVLAPLKKDSINSVRSFNKDLQEIFNPNQDIYIKRKHDILKLNDKVIQCGNNYDKNVFNGTIGMIKEIIKTNDELITGILFNGYRDIKYYNQRELKEIELAYALSIHKSQGSSFKNTIVAIDYSSYILLSRQLVYTAITRAEKYCFVCCELKAFRYAISKDKAKLRNTFLLDFLTFLSKNSPIFYKWEMNC